MSFGYDPFDGPALWSARLDPKERRGFLKTMSAVAGGLLGLGALSEPARAHLANEKQARSQTDMRGEAPGMSAQVPEGMDWVKRTGPAVPNGEIPFVHITSSPSGRTMIEKKNLILPNKGGSLLEQSAEVVALRILPPNMSFDYHRPSQPRLVAVLRGKARMGLRDGREEIVNAGDILLVENMTGEGHTGEFGLDGNYVVTFDAALPKPS